jgi:hypothetical protein
VGLLEEGVDHLVGVVHRVVVVRPGEGERLAAEEEVRALPDDELRAHVGGRGGRRRSGGGQGKWGEDGGGRQGGQ